jgi:flagellar basal-body rod protein FlgB
MISALFSDTNYLAAKKMLDASALRHEAIASNIANLETPNYKRLDISSGFSEELKRAVASKDPKAIADLRPALAVDSLATSPNRDGNTVQLESELLHLNQNSLEHSLEIQMLTSRMLRLRLAITGKPS